MLRAHAAHNCVSKVSAVLCWNSWWSVSGTLNHCWRRHGHFFTTSKTSHTSIAPICYNQTVLSKLKTPFCRVQRHLRDNIQSPFKFQNCSQGVKSFLTCWSPHVLNTAWNSQRHGSNLALVLACSNLIFISQHNYLLDIMPQMKQYQRNRSIGIHLLKYNDCCQLLSLTFPLPRALKFQFVKAINFVVAMFMFRVHVFKVSNLAQQVINLQKLRDLKLVCFVFLMPVILTIKLTLLSVSVLFTQIDVQENIGQTPLSTS